MKNIETTIGNGLSKFENSLEKGKNKMDSMKEISKLNKNIDEITLKKLKSLQELGMIVYKRVAQGLIDDNEINEKCNNIAGFEHLIYESRKRIEDIKKVSEGIICECGSVLSMEDKFCGSCGKKVEIQEELEKYIVCNRCETEISEGSKFCPCCGIKISTSI